MLVRNETRRTKYKEDEEYRKKKQEQIQIMYVIHQWRHNVIQDI